MEPYIGQIALFGFNFAPLGWAQCNGQLLSISSNSALFSLLGTAYGGDGKSTFGLPDLRGRAPVNQGTGVGLSPRVIGEMVGTEAVTLAVGQMPAHGHAVRGSAAATSKTPAGAVPGYDEAGASYAAPDDTVMSPQMIASSGDSGPHDNMSPVLVLNYCIAIDGIFPPRN